MSGYSVCIVVSWSEQLGICCLPSSEASGHSTIALKSWAEETHELYGRASGRHTEHDVTISVGSVYGEVLSSSIYSTLQYRT